MSVDKVKQPSVYLLSFLGVFFFFKVKMESHTAHSRLILVPKLASFQDVCFEGIALTPFQAMTFGLYLQVKRTIVFIESINNLKIKLIPPSTIRMQICSL